MKLRLPKPKKLGSNGIAHYLIPLLIVIAVAVGGTFLLVNSKAATKGSEVTASAAGKNCSSGEKLVNALPREYAKGRVGKAKIPKSGAFNGQICINKNNPRDTAVAGGNSRTIIAMKLCKGGHVWAYDSNNRQSTGFGAAKWRFKMSVAGQPDTAYYCVKKSIIGDCVNNSGKSKGIVVASGSCKKIDQIPFTDNHIYKFLKAFPNSGPCLEGSTNWERSNCKSNQFFFYKYDSVQNNS